MPLWNDVCNVVYNVMIDVCFWSVSYIFFPLVNTRRRNTLGKDTRERASGWLCQCFIPSIALKLYTYKNIYVYVYKNIYIYSFRHIPGFILWVRYSPVLRKILSELQGRGWFPNWGRINTPGEIAALIPWRPTKPSMTLLFKVLFFHYLAVIIFNNRRF